MAVKSYAAERDLEPKFHHYLIHFECEFDITVIVISLFDCTY